jgi:tetratricopeptide (TPR) repeat protein
MRYVSAFAWLTVFLVTSGITAPGFAQAPAAVAPAQPNFDPADVYYQAWLFVREAETLQKQGRHAEALDKFRRAEKFFETIHRFHPEWKKEMVGDRLTLTKNQITKALPLAQDQQKKDDIAVAEIIESGGDKRPVAPMPPARPSPAIEIEDARVKALEAEVKRLRGALASPSNESSREAARASDLEKQRDDLNARLKQTTTELEALRAKMATAPVQSEMDRLNERLRSLEQERQAMGMALSQSREQQLQSQAKIQTLQADYQAMRQQAADLQRNLGVERQKSNEVTTAQLKQLQQLEQTLKQKDTEIAAANQRVSSLENELKESKDAFQELRTERDDLLRERDHMAALLKLNESGRIQQLIEQNMGLAKELREAKERVERISKNNDETNDQLTEALRDLAITKTKIISLQSEKRAQELRLNDLEKQLQNNEKALASGEAAANSLEADTLRDIIKRQQRQIERRKQAAQLLLNAAKKQTASGDANYDEAVALLTDQEMTLTPDEQKILDARQVDGEIYSPYAGSKARVSAATTEMHQQIDDYTKAAVRAFGSQRLSASREVLEMILDLHPGHIPTMTKLGIVQLRLDDPVAAAQTLRAAVENDESRSLSHRLLGLALYKMGDLAGAEEAVTRALEIDPNDAAGYTIYGNTLLRLKRTADAEKAYQKAIALNPESSEALHNLALLCQRDGRIKEAKGYYEEALLHGAQPNPELETALAKGKR